MFSIDEGKLLNEDICYWVTYPVIEKKYFALSECEISRKFNLFEIAYV